VTAYRPAAVILPTLTDEALAEDRPDGGCVGQVRELLLTVPAEYRQAVLVEDHRRTTIAVRTSGGIETRSVRTGRDELAAITAEVRAQLNQEGARS
jgi:hypothetical protein